MKLPCAPIAAAKGRARMNIRRVLVAGESMGRGFGGESCYELTTMAVSPGTRTEGKPSEESKWE